jgi:hypothetical protein
VAIACKPATPAPSIDYRPVAGQVRLRGQDVHALRPGDARQQLHGDGGDAALGAGLGYVRVVVRRHQAGKQRALLHQRHFVRAAFLLFDDRALHFEDHVGAVERRLRRGRDGSPCRLECGVGDGRALAGAFFDGDFEAQIDELLHRIGRGRDAGFAGPALLGDGDFHIG